ncbi:3-deoxy-7-phosphoheptulonate synthase [Halothiobacillus sp.]|uniref:3-deoxy-7-phosphoheptulonate synthase n=1 Tax=Halothiobacillus sp. TaxID=1891311 RepID=UPI002AD5193A|nr:3-deoxy-7-phosphoheptulonate synthase [Halothiobacillus sp.]
MTTHQTDDLRILEIHNLLSPERIRAQFPLTERGAATVVDTRRAIRSILNREDDRLIVVMGPCSIHDVKAAREYADRLKTLADTVSEDILLIMRVYFEKPRTTVGWKGLINDPNLDDSYEINKGLGVARHLLVDLADMGVPAATEYLDLISPQYVSDAVSWGAIGARTTESQVHRELASGLSCPVGFKNGTDGGLQVAIDAIRAAARPHHFLSVTKAGQSAIFSTSGNVDCHIILRGGKKPNFDANSVNEALEQLRGAELNEALMIDFSHANSQKQHARQIQVADDVATQIAAGNAGIVGAMVESHLVGGRQDVHPERPLVFGQSITDACIGWEDSVGIIQRLVEAVRVRRSGGGVLPDSSGTGICDTPNS